MHLSTFILERPEGEKARELFRQMFDSGATYRDIARSTGVCLSIVYQIATGLGVRRRKGRRRGSAVKVDIDGIAKAAVGCLSKPAVTPEPDERESQMLDMAASGATMTQIGEHFGVTRERVRQILQRFHVTGTQLREDRKELRVSRTPIRGFRLAMYRALRAEGYHRCSYCGWQCREKFPEKIQTVCRACNTWRIGEKYRTDPAWREHIRQYNANPKRREKAKEYSKRYQAKESVKKHAAERQRQRAERMKQDPEAMKLLRE